MTQKEKKAQLLALVNQRTKILYRSALICYILPLVLVTLFLLDDHLTHWTGIFFWASFLLSMFPLGLLGLLFSIIGIVQSTRIKNYMKRDTGYLNLFLGIIVVTGGILGWGLIYIMTS